MKVNTLGKFALVGLSAAWLAGCSTTGADTDSSMGTTAQSTEQAAPADKNADQNATYGAGQGNTVTSVANDQDKAKDSKAMLDGVQTVFYFGFDTSNLSSKAASALNKHAQYLLDNPDMVAELQGNTDERGTREYNMALGERRAKAVANYLELKGVPSSQLDPISNGEEKPVAFGHDESAWKLNRRVDLSYSHKK